MKFLYFLLSSLILTNSQILELYKTPSKYHTLINASGKLPLSNDNFFHYYANFQFGTPPQNTTFITDISSKELWILLESQCYRATASSTANITLIPGIIQYGTSYVAGSMGTEMLSISSFQLTNLKMITLFVKTEQNIQTNTACGLMGLSNDISWKNFLEVAVENQQLNDSQFAFQLAKNDQNFFYIGASSFPQNLQLTWINVVRATYWSIAIQATIVGTQTFNQPEGMKEAIIDTGTSLILIQTTAMNGLLQNTIIKNQCQNQSRLQISKKTKQYFTFQSYYLCTCSGSYPTISFQNNNLTLQAQSSNYMIPLGGDFCMLGFQGIDPSELPFIIFGDPFIRGYFLALDKTKNLVGLNL